MSSSKVYLDFVLEQLSGLEEITYRAMMGVVSAKKKMEFTEDTVANHPFVAVEGMSISEVNGKLVIDKAG